MPFDGTRLIQNPKPDNLAPLVGRHPYRGPESVDSTIAVLARARALIADERHWCQGAFARGWANVPVRPRSFFARRFCVVGALKWAACELLLPSQNAYVALEWLVGRRVEGWNDDPKRTHAEVVALFDVAILGLRQAAF